MFRRSRSGRTRASSRPWLARRSAAKFGEPPLDARGQRIGGGLAAGPLAERANGRGHGAQVAVPVFVVANRRALQLRHQIGLTAVEQHEIRPERDDPFHIRIEERADSWKCLHFGRILVVAAHRNHAIARADGKDDLRQGGYKADDRRGWLRLRVRKRREGGREGSEGAEGGNDDVDDDQPNECSRALRPLRVLPHPFLTSNHRKNGPPIIAVTMPTGNSTGAMIVRAIRSQSTRNEAPKSVAAGSTIR